MYPASLFCCGPLDPHSTGLWISMWFSRFSSFPSSLIGWNISRESDFFSLMAAVSNISIHRNVSLLIHEQALRFLLSLLWFADHVTSASHFTLQIMICVPNKVLSYVCRSQTRKISCNLRHVRSTGFQIPHLKNIDVDT